MAYFQIIFGLFLLFAGGEWVIRKCIEISDIFRIKRALIGVIIVGFGTSLPELFTSVDAAFRNYTQLALGNIVGSNIANVLLIPACALLIKPIDLKNRQAFFHAFWMIGLTFIYFMYCFFMPEITRFAGFLFLGLLFIYFIFSVKSSLNTTHTNFEKQPKKKSRYFIFITLQIIIGLALLIFGADICVIGATAIAHQLGVSSLTIGLTIIAIGTSLPELAAAIVASYKRESELLIGDIVGSNIFNLMGVLGISAIIKPILIIDRVRFIENFILIITAALFFTVLYFRIKLTRYWGVSLLFFYLFYLVFAYYHNVFY